VRNSTFFGDIYLEIYFMKVDNLVQEKVPNKLKRLMVLITESQLKNVISKTLDNPSLKKIVKNEKK
jgi:hypothetical protein